MTWEEPRSRVPHKRATNKGCVCLFVRVTGAACIPSSVRPTNSPHPAPATLLRTHPLPSTDSYRPRTLSKWARSEHAALRPHWPPPGPSAPRAPARRLYGYVELIPALTLRPPPEPAEDPVSRRPRDHDSRRPPQTMKRTYTTRAPPSNSSKASPRARDR